MYPTLDGVARRSGTIRQTAEFWSAFCTRHPNPWHCRRATGLIYLVELRRPDGSLIEGLTTSPIATMSDDDTTEVFLDEVKMPDGAPVGARRRASGVDAPNSARWCRAGLLGPEAEEPVARTAHDRPPMGDRRGRRVLDRIARART